MQRFIPMGIIQHMYEFYLWMNLRQIVEVEKSNLKILSLDDLAFGFNIWLGTCGISGVSFLIEIVYFKIREYFSIHVKNCGRIRVLI